MEHINISNVNALQSQFIPPQPTYMAPQPIAPSFEYECPSYGYGHACPEPCFNPFVLIVVLFILLIIVGACIFPC